MDAVEGDLHDPASTATALAAPDLWGFDVAAVGFGAHHFDDPTAVATRLVERLRPGGALFIADLLPYEPPAGWLGDGKGEGAHHHHHHSHGHQQQQQQQKHGDGNEDLDYSRAIKTVARNGFSEDDVRRMFEAAGAAQDFKFEIVPSIEMPLRDKVVRTVFFARGTKSAAAPAPAN